MNILIIEDEKLTANRLEELLHKYDSEFNILAKIPSIEKAVNWFKNNKQPDLIFQDIELSDGNCFEIYEKVKIETPIIFTTAYSQYALESFKLNSIDYILKPYDFADLKKVLEKFEKYQQMFASPTKDLLKEVLVKKSEISKKRFLIKIGDNFFFVNSSDVQLFNYDNGLTNAHTFDNKKYPIDDSISKLFELLDKTMFFQINRKQIVNIDAIQKISTWFTNRLVVKLNIDTEEKIIVSRERVKEFKQWLNL
ncbi:MAG: LytTR family DNA-binding domain-containing protein [Bacteroidota bacterium]|nr:LytTR family DNA-binding domain-containing protein [Bacteroidota bacterium]